MLCMYDAHCHNYRIIPFPVSIYHCCFCFLLISLVTFEVNSHNLFFKVDSYHFQHELGLHCFGFWVGNYGLGYYFSEVEGGAHMSVCQRISAGADSGARTLIGASKNHTCLVLNSFTYRCEMILYTTCTDGLYYCLHNYTVQL